jgi:hypothetical protein
LLKRAARHDLKLLPAPHDHVGRVAENAFVDLAQAGAELVLVLRLGPYAEIDYEELIQFHLDQRTRVTSVCTPAGESLDTFVISASRRNDAAYLLRHALKAFRTPPANYLFDGYLNWLRSSAEIRALAVDGLMMRNQLIPAGLEVRPGVWVAAGARIQKGARVLAPAFIGERAKVRAAAVVTRCTSLEHHSEVDCGTVVEDSSVLPYTYLGAGLDVCHAVVGFKRLSHLRRNVEVEIGDSKLIGAVPQNAPWRTVASAASIASFVPVQFFRGIFSKPVSCDRPSLADAVSAPSPGLSNAAALQASPPGSEANQLSTDLAVARRYGNE